MTLIADENTTTTHYGSTIVGPISSSININVPTFVSIEGKQVLSSEDTIDTPSHEYAPSSFHSHSNQVVDIRAQNFVTIEGNYILLNGDKNNVNDTRLDSAGSNIFVSITI